MYLKRFFNTRKGMIAATAISGLFAIYNLYMLGRCDEVQEIVDLTRSNGKFKPTFKLYNGDKSTISMKEVAGTFKWGKGE